MVSWRAWWGLAEDFGLGVLAPRRCAGCDEPVSRRAAFCVPCAASLEPSSASLAPYFYGGALSRAIMRFKYEGRNDLAEPLGGLLVRALTTTHRLATPVDVVVPVPLHPTRLRERGFNQSALLAQHAARACNARMTHALVRVRPTEKQALGTRQMRLANVEGAFLARREVHGLRVLLVDDVCTTGATLNSCAIALRVAGARGVHCVALSQTWDAPSPPHEKRAIIKLS